MTQSSHGIAIAKLVHFVVGTCAHVASALWYLGVAIHDPEMLKKRKCDTFMSLCLDAST